MGCLWASIYVLTFVIRAVCSDNVEESHFSPWQTMSDEGISVIIGSEVTDLELIGNPEDRALCIQILNDEEEKRVTDELSELRIVSDAGKNVRDKFILRHTEIFTCSVEQDFFSFHRIRRIYESTIPVAKASYKEKSIKVRNLYSTFYDKGQLLTITEVTYRPYLEFKRTVHFRGTVRSATVTRARTWKGEILNGITLTIPPKSEKVL